MVLQTGRNMIKLQNKFRVPAQNISITENKGIKMEKQNAGNKSLMQNSRQKVFPCHGAQWFC